MLCCLEELVDMVLEIALRAEIVEHALTIANTVNKAPLFFRIETPTTNWEEAAADDSIGSG